MDPATGRNAFGAVEATIDRLDELGEVVRQHPALNQGTQVEDATDRDGEGSGLLSIKRVVQSNSPTAPLLLQNHLIASAFKRRDSLRQLKQRQPTRVQQPTDRGGTPAPTMAEDDRVEYPEPPKAEHGKPAPKCPYCCEVLESSDLLQPAWKYVCLRHAYEG